MGEQHENAIDPPATVKQVHGALKQAEGKVQKAWGDAKDQGKKAVDKETENKTNRRVDSVDTENEENVARRKVS
jgi:hypothetical protein